MRTPSAPRIFASSSIEGRVFTMDALLTQYQIAQTIVDHKGDYFLFAKGN